MSIRIGLSRSFALAVALGVAVGFANVASAEMATAPKAAKPAKPKTVTVTGCATKGTPEFCIMIKGPKGANYNVTSASPPVPVGKKVRLKGTVTPDVGVCFGTPLTDVKWVELKGKCPAPK
jgi:3-deoxy-D-arabino-heptulosonate 7-phosphate (DAHP) synthase